MAHISPNSSVRFTLAQVCCIAAALISATWYVSEEVGGVKKSVDRLATLEEGNHTETAKRLDQLDLSIKENTAADREREKLTAQRLDGWNPWRWRITMDIVNLGKKTGTPTYTREEWEATK